jgi:hypothetical protein
MIAVFIRTTPNVEALRQAGKEVEIFGHRREWEHSQTDHPRKPGETENKFLAVGIIALPTDKASRGER